MENGARQSGLLGRCLCRSLACRAFQRLCLQATHCFFVVVLASYTMLAYTQPFSLSRRTLFPGLSDRLNVFINFNKAIQVSVPHAITLKRFKCHITKLASPCERPKIYFNGLQLQTDDQTLANYGISGGSSIYVNTERVIGEQDTSNSTLILCAASTRPAAHRTPNQTEMRT